MAKIVLNDGIERPVEWCGAGNGVLAMEFSEQMEMCDAVAPLYPENMGVIRYFDDAETQEHAGYTRLFNARLDEYNGHVIVSIRKAVNT